MIESNQTFSQLRVMIASCIFLFGASSFSLLQMGTRQDGGSQIVNIPLFVLAQVFQSFASIGNSAWQIVVLDELRAWCPPSKWRQSRPQAGLVPVSSMARSAAIVTLVVVAIFTLTWRFSILSHEKAVVICSRVANTFCLALIGLTSIRIASAKRSHAQCTSEYFTFARSITLFGNLFSFCRSHKRFGSDKSLSVSHSHSVSCRYPKSVTYIHWLSGRTSWTTFFRCDAGEVLEA